MLSHSLRAFTLVAALAAILFLPLAVRAQDDKDAEIERLKKENALLEKQSKAVHDRLLKEIDSLNKTIKERETAIIRLEAEIKRYRIDAAQFEALAKTRQIQNGNLSEQLRAVTLEFERLKGGGAPGVNVIRDPNAPNPPQVKMNGKIEKIDGVDLVQVSLGTDHGLSKGNTLDVYRLTPNPKYLGMIRIIDANHHQSVGRLMPAGNAVRPVVKVGDLVTSKIAGAEQPKEEPPKVLKKLPAGLKGAIEKIDSKDARLVTISLGADAGLDVGHTLEVYGFRPDARHLGSIRIIEVTPRSAIGRRLGPAALEVGDEVVSK